jgi:hypothetical protein
MQTSESLKSSTKKTAGDKRIYTSLADVLKVSSGASFSNSTGLTEHY